MITSAAAISSRAREVSRRGSPGPAPTRYTRPGWTSAAGNACHLLRTAQQVGAADQAHPRGPSAPQRLRALELAEQLVGHPLRAVRQSDPGAQLERSAVARLRVGAQRRVTARLQLEGQSA